MFFKLEKVFKIRVIYKSGYAHDFEVTSFTIKGTKYEWRAVGQNHPMVLGVDDISAVWQISERTRITQ